MRYIILANGDQNKEFKRHLAVIGGEVILKRTIRQLKELGVENIIISSGDPLYEFDGTTRYIPTKEYIFEQVGYWLDAFVLLDEPTTYLFGDVYYTDEAIKTIVETETDDILMFGNNLKTMDRPYMKWSEELFGFKVVNIKKMKRHIERVKKLFDDGKVDRHPIAWELYRSLNDYDINEHIIDNNYITINDITCDIDEEQDVEKLNEVINNHTSS